MAESSKRLTAPLKAAHPDVDWRAISDFRKVLVHDYLGVNVRLVWQIVRDRLRELKRKVAVILESAQG